jgi:hypothetical protein
MDYNLCHYLHTETNGSGYYLAACTDESFSSPLCTTHCRGRPPDVTETGDSNIWACCGEVNGQADCLETTTDTFEAAAPDELYVIGTAASTITATSTISSSSSASGSSSISTTSQTSTSVLSTSTGSGTSSPSSSPSSSNHTSLSRGAIAGVVIGAIAAAALAALAIIAIFRWKRKDRGTTSNAPFDNSAQTTDANRKYYSQPVGANIYMPEGRVSEMGSQQYVELPISTNVHEMH